MVTEGDESPSFSPPPSISRHLHNRYPSSFSALLFPRPALKQEPSLCSSAPASPRAHCREPQGGRGACSKAVQGAKDTFKPRQILGDPSTGAFATTSPPLLYLHTRKHTHASALPLFAPLFSFQDMRLSNSALMQDLAASRAQNRDKEQELCDAYARLERTEARCSELEAG